MIYLELFLGFLQVGLFSFGGAYSAIPLIRDVVLSYGWLDEEMLSYMIAVSESTPGPIMVNLATYVGSSQAGVLGALIATLTVITPAFIIILLVMIALRKLLTVPAFQEALSGIKACVTGVILAVGVFMMLQNCLGRPLGGGIDVKGILITAGLAVVFFGSRKVLKKGISPLILIGIAAVAGILVYSNWG